MRPSNHEAPDDVRSFSETTRDDVLTGYCDNLAKKFAGFFRFVMRHMFCSHSLLQFVASVL